MNRGDRWWVVTDLDGTLLDHEYNLDPAREILNYLKGNGIPIIPCTSKTAAEVRDFREKVNLNDPYIVENGAAVYVNDKQSLEERELVLGRSYNELKL